MLAMLSFLIQTVLLPCFLGTLFLSASEADFWESFRSEVVPRSSTYSFPLVDVEAVCDPVMGLVQGRMRARINNPTQKPLTTLGFNLHANNRKSYEDTAITVPWARVAGNDVFPRLEADGLGLVLPLSRPLAPNAWVEVEMGFSATLGHLGGRGGLLSVNSDNTTLYNWYPEIAVACPDGWHFDPQPLELDPNFVRVVDIRCHLRLPEAWGMLSGGIDTRLPDGSWSIIAPRMRNLAIWMSRDPWIVSLEHSNIQVRVATTKPQSPEAALFASLGQRTLAIAGETFGPYNASGERMEFDVVFIDMQDFGGMESTGLTFLQTDLFDTLSARNTNPLRRSRGSKTLIHEICHNWWMGQVGNDPFKEAWLDEPLTEWSTWYLMERIFGRDAGLECVRERARIVNMLEGSFLPLSTKAADLNKNQFGLLLYYYGPLMYEDLRRRLGTEAFLKVVRSWRDRHLYQEVTRADWEQTFLEPFSKTERAEILKTWVDGKILKHPRLVKLQKDVEAER